MSGKPQYDEPAVIAAALEVFWRHGYAATSISELTAATGLSRSSLYQRFQDKDGLFLEALAAYTARVLQRMEGIQVETPRARLEALLREFVPRDGKGGRPGGCLLARSCAEIPELSDAGRAATLAGLKAQKAIVEGILRDAATKGELSRDADVDALAWYYLGIVQAILNLPQAGASRAALQHMVDIAMSAWPQPR